MASDPNGSCKRRAIYDAMVSFADEVIGNVTNAIRRKQMWENALIVFASDNGGPHVGPADNFPLRYVQSFFKECALAS